MEKQEEIQYDSDLKRYKDAYSEQKKRIQMFVIHNRRTSSEKLRHQYGDVLILDVTSRGSHPWVQLSPFYPHGNIPVPFSHGWVSASVEGIWQGLKVFEQADVDLSKFCITSMKGLKRSTRTYGQVLGHRKGVAGDQLLPYLQARFTLYLPTYHWVLEHYLSDLLTELTHMGQAQTVVLLDYETNTDISDIRRPLSHAGLVKHYLDGNWPVHQPT